MNIPEFSVKRPVTVLMMILVVVVLGAISLSRLGLDMLPDITYPIVSVVTSYKGVAPADMETLVTKPIEEAVSIVKGVKSVKSMSREGMSIVIVEFEWGTNLDFAAQDIRDNIGLIRDFLPEDIKEPLVLKFDVSQTPILTYGITGNLSPLKLKKYIEDTVKPRLERLDGVASVMVLGGKEREIRISIDRNALQARRIPLSNVVRALAMENLNSPAGHLVEGDREVLIRTVGEFKDLDEIRNIIVAYHKKSPVYLKDIAKVEDTYKEPRGIVRMNRQESVFMAVMKESGANIVRVSDRVEKELNKISKQIPYEVEFHPLMRMARVVKRTLAYTLSNGITGAILAVVIMFLFLGSWRPTLIVGFAIPLSIIVTFIAIYFAGYTLNIMTLGGLALGAGMLVDNAVVVIESIYRNMEEGKRRKEASIVGASQVGMAITASTLTTIAVFLPLVYTSGIAGRLSRSLALTIAFALFASLFVALTIIPMMASQIIITARGGVGGDFQRRIENFFFELRDRYKRALDRALRNRKKVLLGVFALFVLAIGLGPFVGAEFMPQQDTPVLLLMIKLPVGISLDRTDQVVKEIENIFLDQKEMVFVGSVVGVSEATTTDAAFGFAPVGVNEGEIFARTVDREDRKRTSTEIADAIRRKLPKIEGAKMTMLDMSSLMMGMQQNPIEVKIFGKDLGALKRIADRVAKEISDIPGIRDVDITLKRGKPELQVIVDRKKAADLGVSVGMVAQTVQTAMQGKVATIYRKGGEETDVRVRFAEPYRKSVEDLKNLVLVSPIGTQFTLDQVADFHYTYGPVEIDRENQERKVSVTANVVGRDLNSVMRDIIKRVSKITLPEGYFIDYGGQYEQLKEMVTNLSFAFVLALLLVYMIMAAQFESLVHPFVVMFTIPLALIGVIFFLLISGKTLSVPSFMGVIMLAGIAVNNAIVMIDYVNQLRRRGLSRHEAILEGCSVRLRPVLITSFTTILGVLPMALSRSQGAEMRSPMAVAIMGGLLTSTFLTLFVIPLFYDLFDGWTRREKKALKEEVE